MTTFSMGYSDDLTSIAEEIGDARHVRYIRTPSGRKLYMPIAHADDDAEIAEIKRLVQAANAGAGAKT